MKKQKHSHSIPENNKYAIWILLAVTFLCYIRILGFNVTQLDDTVFINDKHEFISSFKNIPAAFTQGCFNEKDIYYRPVLLVYFILLNPFTSKSSIAVYHLGSIIFHLLNVYLVFTLLYKLIKNKNHSLWLAAFFALHPAFTMAVAWIPGINDLLLSTFALCYFLTLIKIADGGTWKDILLNALFLFLGLFTKETGSFLPFGAALILWYKGSFKTFSSSIKFLLVCNVAAWMAWFFARKNVLPAEAASMINAEMLSEALTKINGLIQYFGKCILPFNLTVFPTIENTNTLWGSLAILIVTVLIAMNKKRNYKEILFGAAWFVLFLLPIFFVPKNINNQLFEHRLYLPVIGILFLLRQTIVFSSLTNADRNSIIIFIGLVWVIIIHLYLPDFKDTFSFWYKAVAASPDNAYANKLLGIKLAENERKAEAVPYIQKAYNLDSTEKYIHLFMARLIYMPQQKWDSARYMLEREIKITPGFPDNYAELAHVCFELKDRAATEKYILKYLELNPRDEMLNSNLLLLYRDQGKYKQAKEQADKIRAMGIFVDENLYNVIADSAKINFSETPDSVTK
ncbi:MAG TPA: hypothetical protein VJY62_16325 [Bacteroidia bacterium]|nr:hypothetical protein [Bacteroidia bacterium]